MDTHLNLNSRIESVSIARHSSQTRNAKWSFLSRYSALFSADVDYPLSTSGQVAAKAAGDAKAAVSRS